MLHDKVIYTAIIGNYEDLKEPTMVTPGWQYLCYTDQPLESKTWKIIRVKPGDNPQRKARLIKVIGQMAEKSIWVDASFTINTNLNTWWKQHFKSPITAIRHPVRRCAYMEADVCVMRGLDIENVKRQIAKYRTEGMPEKNGLISSGILMRDNSEAAKWFNLRWRTELQSGSIRDQIGFAYCAWKMPVVNYINHDYRTSNDFIYTKHYHARDKEPH